MTLFHIHLIFHLFIQLYVFFCPFVIFSFDNHYITLYYYIILYYHYIRIFFIYCFNIMITHDRFDIFICSIFFHAISDKIYPCNTWRIFNAISVLFLFNSMFSFDRIFSFDTVNEARKTWKRGSWWEEKPFFIPIG